MKTMLRLSTAAGTAVLITAGLAATANANAEPGGVRDGAHNAVFVQTDNPAGNQILAYHRDAHGRLTRVGAYATGGLGGVLPGSVVDHLGSQGSLAYDARSGLLLAVNGGSDTVSVFAADGDRLKLIQVVPSGGSFPSSIAVHDGVVYVLNSLGGGSIQGFSLRDGSLTAVAGWHRELGLAPNITPGQVGFTADGSKLAVTTKAGGGIDVFPLTDAGAPAAVPVVTSLPGAVPFAFVVDDTGRLIVAEAGTDAVAAFTVARDGALTQGPVVAAGQAGTCWIASAGDKVYASNAGSSTLSGFAPAQNGGFTSLGDTPTDAGTVDAAAAADGHYLYAQTGKNGIVDEFAVGHDGALTLIGSETVPGAAGGQGIVAF